MAARNCAAVDSEGVMQLVPCGDETDPDGNVVAAGYNGYACHTGKGSSTYDVTLI